MLKVSSQHKVVSSKIKHDAARCSRRIADAAAICLPAACVMGRGRDLTASLCVVWDVSLLFALRDG